MWNWLKYFDKFIQFLDYPENFEERKRLMISRSRFVSILSLALFGIVVYIYISFYRNALLYIFLKYHMTSAYGLMGLLILFSACFLCYSIGIWRVIKKLNETKSLRDTLSNDVKVFMEANQIEYLNTCKNCDKYSDSIKLIQNSIDMHCPTHEVFIDFFMDSTKKEPKKKLDIIQDDFNKFKSATLLCVLLSPQYFDTKKGKLQELTHYFISFYPDLKDERKKIKRIFCKSAIVAENDTVEDKKEKSLWMFQYILINYCTNVETCYLIDEEELKCHLDYVIGKYRVKKQFRPLRKYYFSSGLESSGETIYGNDQMIFSLLEDDFYERLNGVKSNGDKRISVVLESDNKLMELVARMELEPKDLREAFKSLKINLESCIKASLLKHRELKKELYTKIQAAEKLLLSNSGQKKIEEIKEEIKKEVLL